MVESLDPLDVKDDGILEMYLNISEQGAINIFGSNCRWVPAAKGAEYELAKFSNPLLQVSWET